jgi:hypothetical protein
MSDDLLSSGPAGDAPPGESPLSSVRAELAAAGTTDLLGLYRSILGELRRRDVIRTDNAPAGDYGEYLVATAFGGVRAPNSEKSWDVAVAGKRIQVECRIVSDPPARGQLQLSPFRSFAFDVAIIMLLSSDDCSVRRAVEVPASVVEELSRHSAHVNGAILRATAALFDHDLAIDVTEQLRAAARTM